MPEVERTLIIIKAHALTDNSPRQRILLVERALSEYGKLGLKTILKETIRITPEQAQEFYKEHRGKPYHAGLMDSIDGFSIIIILDGEDAIQKVRKLHGPTKQSLLRPGNLRRLFARLSVDGPYTGLHASDSPENFERECRILGITVPN